MIPGENDPFKWRTQGKRFEIGDENEGGIGDMITVGDILLCITKKNIHSIQTADSVDPNHKNPKIPDIQQKVLPYGSEEPIVGRTLLQTNVLFESNLINSIDGSRALSIAFAFLKEIISLNELTTVYVSEVNEKNNLFEGKTGKDGSLRLPTIDNLEQRTKHFLINADHALCHLIEISQLFYPDIKNKNWCGQLKDKLTVKENEEN